MHQNTLRWVPRYCGRGDMSCSHIFTEWKYACMTCIFTEFSCILARTFTGWTIMLQKFYIYSNFSPYLTEFYVRHVLLRCTPKSNQHEKFYSIRWKLFVFDNITLSVPHRIDNITLSVPHRIVILNNNNHKYVFYTTYEIRTVT